MFSKLFQSIGIGSSSSPSSHDGWLDSLATSSPRYRPSDHSGRNQLIQRLIVSLVGTATTFAVLYYVVRWMSAEMDPTKKEKDSSKTQAQKLLQRLGMGKIKLTEYELCVAADIVPASEIDCDWSDVAGLDNLIDELLRSVVLPIQRSDLIGRSKLLQPPKGILLHGPPGCGKTLLVKALAKNSGAVFVNLQLSSLFDKWYGESQKRAQAVFSLASKIQPAIIFIDEIDSFLRVRSSVDHESTAMMKTQFMALWDGLLSDPHQKVIIIGATNRPQDVDPAILRRMTLWLHVPSPSAEQRAKILRKVLEHEEVDPDLNLDAIAQQCQGFSGSDLKELCRQAAIRRLSDWLEDGEVTAEDNFLRPIIDDDFNIALRRMLRMRTGDIME